MQGPEEVRGWQLQIPLDKEDLYVLFKNKGLRNLGGLVDILEGKRATGEFALSRGKKRIRSASEDGEFIYRNNKLSRCFFKTIPINEKT